MHGDHIFGLPGLLLGLQMVVKARTPPKRKWNRNSRPEEKMLVQIYGPVGLYNFIATSLSLSSTELKHLTVEVHEFQGGSLRLKHPGAIRNYGEFRHQGLVRKGVPQNDDGTWTVSEATEILTPEDAERYNSDPHGVYVTAAELHHVPKLQCFGYVVREPTTQPRSLDVDSAIALGVKPGEKYKILKSGFPVMSDDDSREVQPDEVLVGETPTPRSLALFGDCCGVPGRMRELCRGVDVLVHEATIKGTDTGNRVDFGGHSTPAMAGRVADEVNAKVLVLNHLSPTSRFRAAERALAREAEQCISGRTKVQVAYDHLELLVPRSGFPW